MKAFIRKFYLFLLFAFLIGGCKEKFEPELKDTNTLLLVVEGIINVGGERTAIKLSRTAPISKKGGRVPEVGATVSFESDANQTYTLVETSPGTYESAVLNLNPNLKYRLKIVAKGVEYRTDFLEAKVTPPIDDITWKRKDEGLEISVSAHDDSKKTRYYRWDYDEAWIFYPQYASFFIYKGSGLPVTRNDTNENISRCWSYAGSTNALIGSSMKLNDDVIHQNPLTLIPNGSERFTEKYSILVKQYALTKEAFEFWDNLRKNTESLGSIFDAQPSELVGNIKNIKNPSEPVLGFISVGSVQSKRIFITRQQVQWRVQNFYTCVKVDTVELRNVGAFSNPNYLPLEEVLNNVGALIGYSAAERLCVDCTLKGSNVKPSFWQ